MKKLFKFIFGYIIIFYILIFIGIVSLFVSFLLPSFKKADVGFIEMFKDDKKYERLIKQVEEDAAKLGKNTSHKINSVFLSKKRKKVDWDKFIKDLEFTDEEIDTMNKLDDINSSKEEGLKSLEDAEKEFDKYREEGLKSLEDAEKEFDKYREESLK